MSSELSPRFGEFSFNFCGLERVMAAARICDNSASRSSVVSVSGGGAKVMVVSGLGSEPCEVVRTVVAACGRRFQGKTMGCRSRAQLQETHRVRTRENQRAIRRQVMRVLAIGL